MEGWYSMNFKKIFLKQKGITLIEVVAVLVIISFLSLLILNVLTDSSQQYNVQVAENTQINDISYILKLVTKEIRMTSVEHIIEIDNGIRFNNSNTNYQLDTANRTIYKYSGDPNTYSNRDEVLANQINTFKIEKIKPTKQGSNTGWHILIEDQHNKKIETTIFSRS
ncbi:type II secretion system protein [Rummeliibacillus sp. TYF005]|nr:type II secretion system protein [Rummeliibacillus sp. POC4]RPJ97344.1 type II secretion system protein [Rummeliibacillus sp. TYF005]